MQPHLGQLVATRAAAASAVERHAAELVAKYMHDNDIEILRVDLKRSNAVDVEDDDLNYAIGNLPLTVIPWGGSDLDYYVSRVKLDEWLR